MGLPRIIDHNGVERFLGNIPKPLRLKWRVFGDLPNCPLIPRNQWEPVTMEYFCPPIKDQDGIGACNCFDTCSTIEGAQSLEGLVSVPLSCGNLYGRINGGRDDGSTLEDAIAEAMTIGIPPASLIPELEWQPSQWPSGWEAAAEANKITEAYWCPTFDHMGSALQYGFRLSTGLIWYDSYDVGGDGWLPSRPGRGSGGGHAVSRDQLCVKNGVWGLGGPNSWGKSWGANGRMVIAESLYGGEITGCWAVKATGRPPTHLPGLLTA